MRSQVPSLMIPRSPRLQCVHAVSALRAFHFIRSEASPNSGYSMTGEHNPVLDCASRGT